MAEYDKQAERVNRITEWFSNEMAGQRKRLRSTCIDFSLGKEEELVLYIDVLENSITDTREKLLKLRNPEVIVPEREDLIKQESEEWEKFLTETKDEEPPTKFMKDQGTP